MYESGFEMCLDLCIEENQPLRNFHLLYTSFSVYIVPLVVGLHCQIVENPSLIFVRVHHLGCICKTVSKVIDPILIFAFLSNEHEIWQI